MFYSLQIKTQWDLKQSGLSHQLHFEETVYNETNTMPGGRGGGGGVAQGGISC